MSPLQGADDDGPAVLPELWEHTSETTDPVAPPMHTLLIILAAVALLALGGLAVYVWVAWRMTHPGGER